LKAEQELRTVWPRLAAFREQICWSSLDRRIVGKVISLRRAATTSGQIANPPRAPVAPAHLCSSTAAADCFFERRKRVMTRAFGSPKMPRIVGCGRKPSNAHASDSRLCRLVEFAIRT